MTNPDSFNIELPPGRKSLKAALMRQQYAPAVLERVEHRMRQDEHRGEGPLHWDVYALELARNNDVPNLNAPDAWNHYWYIRVPVCETAGRPYGQWYKDIRILALVKPASGPSAIVNARRNSLAVERLDYQNYSLGTTTADAHDSSDENASYIAGWSPSAHAAQLAYRRMILEDA